MGTANCVEQLNHYLATATHRGEPKVKARRIVCPSWGHSKNEGMNTITGEWRDRTNHSIYYNTQTDLSSTGAHSSKHFRGKAGGSFSTSFLQRQLSQTLWQ